MDQSLPIPHIVSLVVAWVLLIVWVIVNLVVFIKTSKVSSESRKPSSRFREVFSGIRAHNWGRGYILISVFIRKIFYISVMLTVGQDIDEKRIVQAIIMIETLLNICLVATRPYSRLQDNLIEISNQLFFFTMSWLSYKLHDHWEWNEFWEITVLFLVFANNAVVLLILLFFFIRVWFKTIISIFKSKDENSNDIVNNPDAEQPQNRSVLESGINTPHSRIQILESEISKFEDHTKENEQEDLPEESKQEDPPEKISKTFLKNLMKRSELSHQSSAKNKKKRSKKVRPKRKKPQNETLVPEVDDFTSGIEVSTSPSQIGPKMYMRDNI